MNWLAKAALTALVLSMFPSAVSAVGVLDFIVLVLAYAPPLFLGIVAVHLLLREAARHEPKVEPKPEIAPQDAMSIERLNLHHQWVVYSYCPQEDAAVQRELTEACKIMDTRRARAVERRTGEVLFFR